MTSGPAGILVCGRNKTHVFVHVRVYILKTITFQYQANLCASHENKHFVDSVSKLVEKSYVILARCQGPWGLNAPRLEGAKLYQTLSMEPEGPKDRWCNGAKARRLEGPQARE